VLVIPKHDRVAERRKATRAEILEAAWKLAQEKGLADFTLRDLAERVGMRAPSLYFQNFQRIRERRSAELPGCSSISRLLTRRAISS
jgi:AcrR family transcriptional regulator